ncbi:MAG: fructosamine kinase family protein [Acidobacteria bacterium]|nr:fructosamine kinase family protein [Acidobacteriota bacterium]
MSVTRRAAPGGGSVSRVEQIDTTAGAFVLKWMTDPPDGFVEAEAAGLDALRAAASGFVIPRVVATSLPAACGEHEGTEPPFLIIEYLAPGNRPRDIHEQIGRHLASLHRTSRKPFGFHRDTFCGATRQPNPATASWIEFYATSRLGHQIQLAASAGHIDAHDARRLDRLVDRLDTLLLEPVEGPALIHGDLWTGNLLVTDAGTPALIDPAVSFSHREAEFGIMTLFGGFPARVFEAYHEAWPLDAGWRDRHPIYQLYHLLNHLNLFGAGYQAEVMAIARRFA